MFLLKESLQRPLCSSRRGKGGWLHCWIYRCWLHDVIWITDPPAYFNKLLEFNTGFWLVNFCHLIWSHDLSKNKDYFFQFFSPKQNSAAARASTPIKTLLNTLIWPLSNLTILSFFCQSRSWVSPASPNIVTHRSWLSPASPNIVTHRSWLSPARLHIWT